MIGIYDDSLSSDLSYKERLDIYKNVGFKEVALYIDDKYNKENESYIEIIKYAREIGLNIMQVHIDYKISNFLCDECSDIYFEYVSSKIKEVIELRIPYVVAHASMTDNPPKVNNKQLNKFKLMMQEFEQENIVLCIENVRNNYNLEKILKLNLKNVGMCFDLGHAHCYDNEYEIFKNFKNYIKCSHLHNNFGKDSHNILTDGEIEYNYFVNELRKLRNCSNCLECFPKNKNLSKLEFVEYVKKCYDTIK